MVFRLLHPVLQRALESLGYRRPTPVQARAIPYVLRGFNTLIVAPTGSGKTEAALLPVMSRMIGYEKGVLGAVYITPLRSLNRDIFRRLELLAEKVGLTLQVRHGDSSVSEKRRFLEEPPNIMITTPESFYFLLSVPRFREIIRSLRYVIVDEAHEVFSSKRGAELSLAIERVDRLYAYRPLQLIGLSATVRRPHIFARRLFGHRYYVVVEEGGGKEIESVVDAGGGDVDAVGLIADYIRKCRGKTIVFTNTRDTAEVLGASLKQVLGEDVVEVHHGSLGKRVRVGVEEALKKGKLRAVVATSSLELGIDIGDVEQVVQFMSPRQVVKYTQRVGRSGHGFGRRARGVIVSNGGFFDILESAVIAARASRGNLEDAPFYHKALDALMHQVVGTVLELGEASVDKLYWLVTRSEFYRGLGRDEFEALLEVAVRLRFLRRDGDRLRLGPRLRRYYFATTMIPDTKQYRVIDTASGSQIGVLDEEFVATLERGSVFLLSGRTWQVVDIDERSVKVREVKLSRLVPPAWEGDLIPVEYGVAREAASILRRYRDMGCRVLDGYPLTRRAREKLCRTLSEHAARSVVPDDKTLVVEVYGSTVVFYTFLGSRGNKAFEYLVSGYIEETLGYPPRSSSTPYIVVVEYASPPRVEQVKDLIEGLKRLKPHEAVELVRSAARRSRLYWWMLYFVARRSGAIPSDASIKDVKRSLTALSATILGEEAMRELEVKKMDYEPVLRLLERLRRGHVKVEMRILRDPSPLAAEALSAPSVPERLRPKTLPTTILAEAVKRRIMTRRVHLVCMMCGEVLSAEIGRLPDKPRCPRCGSSLLAVTRSEEDARKLRMLVLRQRRGARLRRDEAKTLKSYTEAASLVLEYGRKAVEALSHTGVGVHTAKQVLRKLVFGEENFYKALVEAEARYHTYKHKLRN